MEVRMSDMKPTNPKDAIGSKKLPYRLIPKTASAVQALVHLHGALKYGEFNWRDAGVRISVYVDAIHRHLAAFENGEDLDPESGLSHLGHIMACAAIVLDAGECGKLTDDRPPHVDMAKLHARANEIAKLMIEDHEGADDDTELLDDWIWEPAIDDDPLSIFAGDREPTLQEQLPFAEVGWFNVVVQQWQ